MHSWIAVYFALTVIIPQSVLFVNTVNAYWQERNSNIYMSIPGEEYEFYVIGNNNVELDGIINNETIYRITCR